MRLLPVLLLYAAVLGPGHAFAFDGIRVTLLGTGTGERSAAEAGPGTVIEAGDETILIDCGSGSLARLQRAGLEPFHLTAVFLTSLDADHVEGCKDIWRGALRGSSFQGLSVWGPVGTAELFRRLDEELGFEARFATRAFDISDNVVYQPETVTVTAFVTQPDRQVRRFGYRVDANRRSVVVSPDAGSPASIVEYARGAQLLLQEVSGRAESAEGHAAPPTPEQAAQLFRASRPYLAVYSHIMGDGASEDDLLRRTRRNYRGLVQVGRDLMVIEVQNEVQIRAEPSEPRLR